MPFPTHYIGDAFLALQPHWLQTKPHSHNKKQTRKDVPGTDRWLPDSRYPFFQAKKGALYVQLFCTYS